MFLCLFITVLKNILTYNKEFPFDVQPIPLRYHVYLLPYRLLHSWSSEGCVALHTLVSLLTVGIHIGNSAFNTPTILGAVLRSRWCTEYYLSLIV